MHAPRLGYVILLDALRHDFIDQTRTPFLYSARQQARHARVIETFAFQTRPAYFAGLEPEESNICHLFAYDPEGSPFQFLAPLRPLLRGIEQLGVSRIGRGLIRRTARQIEMHRGNVAAAEVMGTERIPLPLLPNFALSERRHTDDPDAFPGHPTFFDRLRARNVSWSWIGYPRHFGSTAQILSAYREAPESDVVYLHFSELDWLGHRYGPGSPEIDRALRSIDETLRELLEHPLTQGKRAVIFGDHGMVRVERQIDLAAALQALPLKLERDYLYFLDSTQARFWFNNVAARGTILEALATIPGGHVLSPHERERLRIRFTHRRFGDEIFMLDTPAIIHPSFFATGPSAPLGMHGYLPDMRDNATQVLAIRADRAPASMPEIPMTEIFHLLCDTFEV